MKKVDLPVLYYCFIVVGSLQGYHQPLPSIVSPTVYNKYLIKLKTTVLKLITQL